MNSNLNSFYLLRWSDHITNYAEIFLTLREEEEFVDCSFACDDGIVGAHRVVLAGCSPYLRDLLKRASNPHPIIYLVNVSRSTVLLLMEFIYRGQAYIPHQKLHQLVTLGKSMQVKGLSQMELPEKVPSYSSIPRLHGIPDPGTVSIVEDLSSSTPARSIAPATVRPASGIINNDDDGYDTASLSNVTDVCSEVQSERNKELAEVRQDGSEKETERSNNALEVAESNKDVNENNNLSNNNNNNNNNNIEKVDDKNSSNVKKKDKTDGNKKESNIGKKASNLTKKSELNKTPVKSPVNTTSKKYTPRQRDVKEKQMASKQDSRKLPEVSKIKRKQDQLSSDDDDDSSEGSEDELLSQKEHSKAEKPSKITKNYKSSKNQEITKKAKISSSSKKEVTSLHKKRNYTKEAKKIQETKKKGKKQGDKKHPSYTTNKIKGVKVEPRNKLYNGGLELKLKLGQHAITHGMEGTQRYVHAKYGVKLRESTLQNMMQLSKKYGRVKAPTAKVSKK